MEKIIYNYKGIDFELKIFNSKWKQTKSRLGIASWAYGTFAYEGLSKAAYVYLNSSDYQEFLKSTKSTEIQNWSFNPIINKYLDYHIKYNLDILEIKNEWFLNPGQICFLGKKHILKWEFKDEITNPLEYKFEISSGQITLFVSRILEKRVIKRRTVLMNFLKEQLSEIIKKIQPKYEEKLLLKPVDFEIDELVSNSSLQTIARAFYHKNLIQYTISMICSDLDLIEHTILHELLHHVHKDNGHSARFYKDGEKFIKDFKLLHYLEVVPDTFYKKF